MKLRVLFLKKIYFIYIVAFLAALMFFLFFFISKPTISAFSVTDETKTIKADLTGDGIDDILYIKNEKSRYYIQIYSQGTSYYLEPNKKLGTVGFHISHWPMKITLMDINRDKIPEIFVQASQHGMAVQHVFHWDGKEFKDIFSSSNNFIGFIDSKNNRTPKFVSGSINNVKASLNFFMYTNHTLQSIDLEDTTVPGMQSVITFIKYVESLPEGEGAVPKEIFYPGLSGKELIAIGKMAGENNMYFFQDATFNDSKWDRDGHITEMKWTMNFKGSSKVTGISKLYSVTIKLRPHQHCDDTGCFKIYSITLNQ